MRAAALALGSAFSWGSADFAGGLAARRSDLFRVVLVSQVVGLILLPLAALWQAEAWPDARGWTLGFAVGLAGAVGITCLYGALASGRMGLAAPVNAVLAASTPVLWGTFTEGAASAWTLVGFGLAFSGIMLLVRSDTGETSRRGLVLALISGVAFGAYLVLLDAASAHGTLWPLTAARVASVSAIGVVALVVTMRGKAVAGWMGGATLVIVLVGGLLDALGNVFFALASRAGRLDAVAVLSSLYPAATVLLARVVLKEKWTRGQLIGAALALASIPFIAA